MSGVQTQIRDANNQLTDVDETIDTRKKERLGINEEIMELKQELKSLQDDINMFPTEVSGFVNQGAKNIRTYLFLATIPTILLVVMAAMLITNAANLTTVLDEVENARVWSILVTRLPYVIIVSALIGASYKLLRFCISEIVKINQQRLNLSKISIVAREVSLASEEGLNFTEEEQYHHRNKLKMGLLKDHLKGYLTTDYSYKLMPSELIPNILPATSKRSTVEDDKVDVAQNQL